MKEALSVGKLKEFLARIPNSVTVHAYSDEEGAWLVCSNGAEIAADYFPPTIMLDTRTRSV